MVKNGRLLVKICEPSGMTFSARCSISLERVAVAVWITKFLRDVRCAQSRKFQSRKRDGEVLGSTAPIKQISVVRAITQEPRHEVKIGSGSVESRIIKNRFYSTVARSTKTHTALLRRSPFACPNQRPLRADDLAAASL